MTLEAHARQRFLLEYRQIRYAEGRGSENPAYYAALPYDDLSGRNCAMWQMRARSYRYFERYVLDPIERAIKRPLVILDLGAGNCWMSYRLSLRNHRVFAVDIFSDSYDGLCARHHYPLPIQATEADFHLLPFREKSFDLAIYNSSLHYSIDYAAALSEARRCLRDTGAIVVLDSPVYRKREHGERMAAERHAEFQKRYGFRSDSIESVEFIDKSMLRNLARMLDLRWKIYRPWYGFHWHLRPWKALLLRRRPPSRFLVLVGAPDNA